MEREGRMREEGRKVEWGKGKKRQKFDCSSYSLVFGWQWHFNGTEIIMNICTQEENERCCNQTYGRKLVPRRIKLDTHLAWQVQESGNLLESASLYSLRIFSLLIEVLALWFSHRWSLEWFFPLHSVLRVLSPPSRNHLQMSLLLPLNSLSNQLIFHLGRRRKEEGRKREVVSSWCTS